MITVKIKSLPSTIEHWRTNGPQIVEALTAKMDRLMILLREKVAFDTIPRFFPNGAPNIAGTVDQVPATWQGAELRGYVTAGAESLSDRTIKVTLKSGEEVDYAAVQEVGVAHSWIIEPFNKKALAFTLNGKAQMLSTLSSGFASPQSFAEIVTKKVIHPPLEARPFMRTAIEEMTPEIIAELKASVEGLLGA
jgi:hypothetical protein